MKKPYLYLLLLIALFSCKKYEDGPWVSLRTKEARITGKWEFEHFEVNGVDSTSAFLNAFSEPPYYIFRPKDKSGDYILRLELGDGKWSFHDHHNFLHISYVSLSSGTPVVSSYNSGEVYWEISRLTNKELWLKTEYNQKHYIAHLKKTKEIKG